MSSFFNMDSPIMRFLSRLCDLMILNIFMPDLLYSDCYNWCIHYRTLFGNF